MYGTPDTAGARCASGTATERASSDMDAGGLFLHWPAWAVMLALRIDYIIKSLWCVSRLMSGRWIHEAGDLRRG